MTDIRRTPSPYLPSQKPASRNRAQKEDSETEMTFQISPVLPLFHPRDTSGDVSNWLDKTGVFLYIQTYSILASLLIETAKPG
jgi:hypothetical protein